MEMKGYIDENLNPKIENVFIIGKERWIPLETVLDTGFNDEFCLQKEYFDECDLIFYGTDRYMLANGSIVTEDIYHGEIVIDNQPITVLLSLTDDDEALIGTRLLDKKIVILNFKDYSISVED
ncbi:hypothetical protein H8E77_30730 [bacterium]|nr:hypothetical protein [bacterium]